MTFQCCFGMCKSQPSPCVSPCSLTSCTRGHCSLCKTAARPPPLPASRQCASFTAHFCSLSFFTAADACFSASQYFIFSHSATNDFSISGPLDRVIVIISARDEGTQGLLPMSHVELKIQLRLSLTTHFSLCISLLLFFLPPSLPSPFF